MRALLGRDKKGVVVLVSSIAGYAKNYSSPLYVATKHALVGFTRSMGDAEELQGVKVVSVCPGYVFQLTKTLLCGRVALNKFGTVL